jgi:hypothetical protein
MELFGIAFSIPGAFVAGAIYRLLLLAVANRWRWIKPLLLWASYLVLAAVLAEWIFLATRGSVGTRMLLGHAYYSVHVLIFFLGTPALMNALILPDPSSGRARWWFAVPLCTALAFVLVVQQYVVSEALYGIDGQDGPFSQIDRM